MSVVRSTRGRRGRGTRGVRTKSVVPWRWNDVVQQAGPEADTWICRYGGDPDAATETLENFLTGKVRPGSHILSDGWHGYRRLKQKGFEHTATAISKQNEPAHELFPWYTSRCRT